MRIVGLTFTAALLGLVAAGAQAPQSPPIPPKPVTQKPVAPRAGAIPRTSDGRPNLQGNWTNATITPLERLGTDRPLVLTEEAAKDEETKTQNAIDARETDSDPNRAAPPVGGEARKSPNAEPTYLERVWQAGAGVVGGYNSFWVDPGDRVLRVDGQPRS